MNKTYEKYIDEYKKDIIREYFYAKNELLNKLYGFEDRGEFTIQVLDELLDLEKENQQLKKQKDDVIEYIKTTKLIDYDNDEVDMLKDTYVGEDLLRMLGEIE